MLGRTGQPFWQDESYDRLVRDEAEFQQINSLYRDESGEGWIGGQARGFSVVQRRADSQSACRLTTCPTMFQL
jgi:hypothetical protein